MGERQLREERDGDRERGREPELEVHLNTERMLGGRWVKGKVNNQFYHWCKMYIKKARRKIKHSKLKF